MNVVEAYIKIKGQLIILVSGLPGCGKTTVGKKISQDFNIDYIDQFNYYVKDYDKKVELPDGSEIVDIYNNDAIDWKKLNKDVNSKKKEGVVVSGVAFPNDKLDFTPDYHIHLSISKKECLERQKAYLEKNKEKYPEEWKDLESGKERLKMNQLVYPYYLETVKESKINKFININNLDDDGAYDSAFDIIISYIQFFLNSDEGQKLYFENMDKFKKGSISKAVKEESSDNDSESESSDTSSS